MQLAALDTALTIDDVDIAGFRLHPFNGAMRVRRGNQFCLIASVPFSFHRYWSTSS